jgi:hypothetical protein
VSLDHLRPYLELEGICRNPVFIIGSPRSGTTALGTALGRHPEFWVSRECYVLHQLYGKGRADWVWDNDWNRTTPSWLRAEGVERAEFLGFLGLAANALFSSRSEGRRWVDQTPLNTPMADDLADMFPGASFLNIVRDGRLVVRSMRTFLTMLEGLKGPIPEGEVPAWTADFRLACETWAQYVETGLSFDDAHPGRCLTIHNEELFADARSAFTRIHEFLDAPDDDGPAAMLESSRVNSSFRRDASRPSDEDWTDWDPEQRATFAEIAGPTLIRAGYADAAGLESWAASGLLGPA